MTAALLVAGALAGMGGAANAGQDAVKGRLDGTVVFEPAACQSPEGVCAEGTVSGGGLKGTYRWKVRDLVATVDTPSTSVVTYVADLEVTTGGGTFWCSDAGAWRTTRDTSIASICVLVGGTGEFLGAQGFLRMTGTADAGSPGVPDSVSIAFEGRLTRP